MKTINLLILIFFLFISCSNNKNNNDLSVSHVRDYSESEDTSVYNETITEEQVVLNKIDAYILKKLMGKWDEIEIMQENDSVIYSLHNSFLFTDTSFIINYVMEETSYTIVDIAEKDSIILMSLDLLNEEERLIFQIEILKENLITLTFPSYMLNGRCLLTNTPHQYKIIDNSIEFEEEE